MLLAGFTDLRAKRDVFLRLLDLLLGRHIVKFGL